MIIDSFGYFSISGVNSGLTLLPLVTVPKYNGRINCTQSFEYIEVAVREKKNSLPLWLRIVAGISHVAIVIKISGSLHQMPMKTLLMFCLISVGQWVLLEGLL